jgi:hypothetical protein
MSSRYNIAPAFESQVKESYGFPFLKTFCLTHLQYVLNITLRLEKEMGLEKNVTLLSKVRFNGQVKLIFVLLAFDFLNESSRNNRYLFWEMDKNAAMDA